jgi:hypothetical protein
MTKVTDICDLDKGDRILFNDRVHPCEVTEEADPPNEGNGYRSAKLEGPQGAYIVLCQEYQDPPYTTTNPYQEITDLKVVS